MNLYNESISSALRLLEHLPVEPLQPVDWVDAGKQNLVLRSEMAYELGSGTLPACSFLAVTSSQNLVAEDGIYLCGKDLPQIKEDAPYARLTLLRVSESALQEGGTLYDTIRRLEYTRYKVNPKGFMFRISSRSNKEAVRISRLALEQGLDFGAAGKVLLDAYHAHPEVEAVQVFFITHPQFPYKMLSEVSKHSEEITHALDHILRNVKMDCSSCGLKEICSEVEELRELHFKSF